MYNVGKNNDPILRTDIDGWTSSQTDGQYWFQRTLSNNRAPSVKKSSRFFSPCMLCGICLLLLAYNFLTIADITQIYSGGIQLNFVPEPFMLKTVISTAWKVSVFRIILVCIFSHLDWIQKDTEYLSVFNPNAGKCGPE